MKTTLTTTWLFALLCLFGLVLLRCSSRPTESASETTTIDSVASYPDDTMMAVDSTAAYPNPLEEATVDTIASLPPSDRPAPSRSVASEPVPEVATEEPAPSTLEGPVMRTRLNRRSNSSTRKLPIGTANFIVPTAMFVDTSYMGYLAISTQLSYRELERTLLSTFYDENNLPPAPKDSVIIAEGGTDKLRIYPYMKGDLHDVTSDAKRFDINCVSAAWQSADTDSDSVFVWRWNITPKVAGQNRLQLNIYGAYEETHTERAKHVLLLNTNIKVTAVKQKESFIDGLTTRAKQINDYWQVYTSGIVGIVMLFFRNKLTSLFKRRGR